MRTRYLTLAVFAAAVLLSPIRNVEACGPFFEPDIFVSTTGPDDLASFANGKLGILQAGFDSNEYAVAFRYLNGGKLSDAERRVYVPVVGTPQPVQDWRNLTPAQIAAAQEAQKQARQNAQPAGRWLLARTDYLPPSALTAQQPSFPTDYLGDIVYDESYLNCPDAAFVNAVLTLKNRAEAWGKQSKWLADWIQGQEAVFSNCYGKSTSMPAPATTDSPVLLKADRAYQIASATFYAKRFDEAANLFAAIAADRSSPWNSWGAYLAARATVRKAFAMGNATNPWSGDLASYDNETMLRAQHMLETLLTQPNPAPSRRIVQEELNFILIRTESEKRAAEICAALAGPEPDANFAQDLKDLNWLLEKQVDIKVLAPLMAWIDAWRGSGTATDAFATWQQGHALPWLVVAMAKASPSDKFASELIDAASRIAPGTPAYDTVFYHRVRLLIGLKRTDEARTLLDAAIPVLRRQKPNSELNSLLGERLAVARDFNEFLEFAPRMTLSTGSQAAGDLQDQCNENAHFKGMPGTQPPECPEVHQPWFDEDAVQVLNQQMPVSLLTQAANTPAVPQNLRQSLAIVAWTRSVLLQDAKAGATLAPLLPKAIRNTAGSSVDFSADLAILRNPGIRPYLEAGVPRVASYSAFDEFRDNGWCKTWKSNYDFSQGRGKTASLPVPSFISSDQSAQAAAEYQRLQQLPDSAAIIGRRVIDYAKQHPADPLVPEALALTVRATHYSCQTWDANAAPNGKSEYTPVSKEAFDLLHKNYAKSLWTAKTPYYY